MSRGGASFEHRGGAKSRHHSQLIDRITRGFERKAARGEWLGGPGPFGYHVDPATKTLVPDPREATTVQRIFSAYADEHLGATGPGAPPQRRRATQPW